MYYVYLIKRADTEWTYIGYTNDIERRIKEHRSKGPELVYYEAYKDRRDALTREKKLKQRGQSIRRLRERLRYSLQ